LEITTSLTDEQVEDALGSTVPGSALWVNMLPGSLVFDVPEGEGDIQVQCITLPGYIIRVKIENTAAISTLCHEDEEPIFVTKNGYGDMVLMNNPASAPARIDTTKSEDAIIGAYIKAVKITPEGPPAEHTALDLIQNTSNGAVKVLLNGQILIFRGGKIYDALGRLVE